MFVALLLSTAQAAPVAYTLDAAKSRLYVEVLYSRSSAIKGHDHVVVARDFTGTVTWDTEDLSACSVEISFPVSNLVVDPGDARSWADFEGSTSESDKEKIKKNIMGRYQLDASSYPTISYSASSCVATGDKVDVTGTLTMHGVGKSLTVPMKVTADESSFAAKGTFSATHGDWGFDPFSALLGALKNDNTLTFTVDVKGAP